MSADFTPTLEGYSNQGQFRFWCQKVLPLVYDDSLSYYELLNKMVIYLNNTISDVAHMGSNVNELLAAYELLQHYVNTYFDNLDVQNEINNKLDDMAADGTLTILIKNVVGEEAAEAVTDWMDEHLTPTTPIVDNSLTISGAAADSKTVGDNFFAQYNRERADKLEIQQAITEATNVEFINLEVGAYVAINNGVADVDNPVVFGNAKYTVDPCTAGEQFIVVDGINTTNTKSYAFLDANNNVLASASTNHFSGTITAPTNTAYILFNWFEEGTYFYKGHKVLTETDKTLTLEGIAADAKTIGDILNKTLYYRGTITDANTSPDDLLKMGEYYITQNVATAWKTNYDFPFTTASRFIVIGGDGSSASIVLQIIATGTAHIYFRTHTVTSPGDFTPWRIIVEQTDFDTFKTLIESYVSSEIAKVYNDNIFDYSTIGNTTYPYGFRTGYFSLNTGVGYTSQQYLRTVNKIKFNNSIVKISPPSDYFVAILIYDSYGTFESSIGNYNATSNGVARSFIADKNKLYNIVVGKFTDDSAATKAQDPDFINSFICNIQTMKITEQNDYISKTCARSFKRFGVYSDSLASGRKYLYNEYIPGTQPNIEGVTMMDDKSQSWAVFMSRYLNNNVFNHSQHGMSADVFISGLDYWNNTSGTSMGDNCLFCACDGNHDVPASIIAFGSNNHNGLEPGTIDDIKTNPENNENTVFGWRGRLIQMLSNYYAGITTPSFTVNGTRTGDGGTTVNYSITIPSLPGRSTAAEHHIFILIYGYYSSGVNVPNLSAAWNEIYDKLKTVVEAQGNYLHIIDMSKDSPLNMNNEFFKADTKHSHWTSIGYSAIGELVANYMSKYIWNNPTLFKMIDWIPFNDYISSYSNPTNYT